MLREIKHKNPNVRWFNDADHDLYLHFSQDGILASLEFCYDKTRIEHVLVIKPNAQFEHYRVDSGEGEEMTYKRTPLFVANGKFDLHQVTKRLLEIIQQIPLPLVGMARRFVDGERR